MAVNNNLWTAGATAEETVSLTHQVLLPDLEQRFNKSLADGFYMTAINVIKQTAFLVSEDVDSACSRVITAILLKDTISENDLVKARITVDNITNPDMKRTLNQRIADVRSRVEYPLDAPGR